MLKAHAQFVESYALNASLQVTGFGYEHDEAWSANMELFKELTDVSRGVRRLGAAAIDLCHVALGIQPLQHCPGLTMACDIFHTCLSDMHTSEYYCMTDVIYALTCCQLAAHGSCLKADAGCSGGFGYEFLIVTLRHHCACNAC